IFEPMFFRFLEDKAFTPPQDVTFFRSVQKGSQPYERLATHVAWHGQSPIAAHLGSFTGDTAVYLLGAATSRGRELRASYLLQWAVIQYAKSIGNTWYDLGGIDERANPDVYHFKKRLNGRRITELGSYELAPHYLNVRALHLLEDAYSR